MAKKAVSRASINIAKGLVKDVTLLRRYVGQEPEPADAVALLEECIDAGSKRLRAGAFPLLAERNLERAEQLALALAAQGERSKKAKERAENFAFLTTVATTKCLDRAEALGIDVGIPYHLERALDWLKRRLERQREAGASVGWLEALAGRFRYGEEINPARDWVVSLLDEPRTSADERAALFAGLVASRYQPVLSRADLPDSLVPSAAFASPSAECFERLAPFLDRLPAADALAEFKDANMMMEPADERWFDYWMRRFDGENAERQLEILAAVKHAARRDADAAIHALLDDAIFTRLADVPWSEDTMQYFRSPSVWRNPHAADVMMKAVEHASITYNDQGHRRIAGYLDSLHAAGRAEHLPTLEKLARHVASITDGSRAAAAWFGQAITAIRQRT